MDYQLLQSLTRRDWATHTDRSDVGYSCVLGRCANLPNHTGNLSIALRLEGLCPGLIVLENVPDTAIKIDASGEGQCHKRPFHWDGFSSNGESKKNGGQQGCEYHDCSANVAR
jgi:hypothetical protein